MPCTRAFVLPRWPSADLPQTTSTCDLNGQDIADCPRTKTALSGTAAISRRPPLPARRQNRPIDRRWSTRWNSAPACWKIFQDRRDTGFPEQGDGGNCRNKLGSCPCIPHEQIQLLEQATDLGGTRFPREGIQVQGHGPLGRQVADAYAAGAPGLLEGRQGTEPGTGTAPRPAQCQ